MIIKNGFVFQEDGTFEKKDLFIEAGKIVSSSQEVLDKTELDASGLKVIAGLIDIHSHGASGHDFFFFFLEGLKTIFKYE